MDALLGDQSHLFRIEDVVHWFNSVSVKGLLGGNILLVHRSNLSGSSLERSELMEGASHSGCETIRFRSDVDPYTEIAAAASVRAFYVLDLADAAATDGNGRVDGCHSSMTLHRTSSSTGFHCHGCPRNSQMNTLAPETLVCCKWTLRQKNWSTRG